MPWTCPKCDRTLSRPNAWHQCMRKPLEALFERKDPALYPLFLEVHTKLCEWKDVQGSATQNCIVYIAQSTFLIIRPMKAALDLKLYLKEEVADFPVYKVEQWGKKQAHHIRLFDKSDLDGSVWKLLLRSYEEDKATGKE